MPSFAMDLALSASSARLLENSSSVSIGDKPNLETINEAPEISLNLDDVEEEKSEVHSDENALGLSNEEILKLFSRVKGDQNRYRQILLNFLSNAVKFTKRGKSICITLTILDVQMKDPNKSPTSRQKNDKSLHEFSVKFQIEIKDEGIGISKDDLEKLFVDFLKLESSENLNLEGTGLGLSICKRIIEEMGGNVRVSS